MRRTRNDAVNRLTRVQFANHADTYAYDAAGNRTAKNGAPYTYNARGELTASPGGNTYSYDPQGR
ncbi:MAG: hypothetical protein HYX29_04055, partial [Solirubrobacterales bacterium]|nr:hypothetical protein [Solirubrobacterales bacterium]